MFYNLKQTLCSELIFSVHCSVLRIYEKIMTFLDFFLSIIAVLYYT